MESSAPAAQGLEEGHLEPDISPARVRPARRFERQGSGPFGRHLVNPLGRSSRARAIAEGPSDSATLHRDALYRRSLVSADALAAALVVFLAVPLTGAGAPGVAALLAVPFVVLASKIGGLYDRDEHVVRKTTLDEIPLIFWVATMATLVLSLSAPELMSSTLSRPQLLTAWVTLLGAMTVLRLGARRTVRAVTTEENCLVLGPADAADALRTTLARTTGTRARIVGRVPLEPESAEADRSAILGDFSTLGIVLAEHSVDRVVIAPEVSDSDRVLHAIRLVKALGVKVSVLPRLFEVVGSSVEFDLIDGITLLGVRRYGLSRSSRRLKRTLDLVGGTLIFLVLAPLMALIALAIKLDSSGPVLFRQRRMGASNVPFEICKFRTMVIGAEADRSALMKQNEAGGGLFKIKDDPRVTRVGRLLRKTSLDELPQLFNVLRGEMALVGPRPLVVEEDRRVEGWQRRRLLVPPGMTGLWQVFGSARIPLNEMVKIDYLYGANWSLWLDIKILLRTVPFVLGRRGL